MGRPAGESASERGVPMMPSAVAASCRHCGARRAFGQLLRVTDRDGREPVVYVCRPTISAPCIATVGPRDRYSIEIGTQLDQATVAQDLRNLSITDSARPPCFARADTYQAHVASHRQRAGGWTCDACEADR